MASLKGTRTEVNLLKSFAGESQARNRYTFFASVAKKEGLEQISAIFTETADQEKEHAKRFFKFLEGGNVEITMAFPAGKICTTLENLKAAAAGEHEEWYEAYPAFAAKARFFHQEINFLLSACLYRQLFDAPMKYGAVFSLQPTFFSALPLLACQGSHSLKVYF